MSATHQRQAVDPSLVLGAWLEPLIGGRRVALLGDSGSPLGARLARGAGRRIHVYDPDPQRTAAALARRAGARESSVVCAPFDELRDAHQGAFDAVVISDLAAFEDAAEVIALAESLLSPRGVLAVVSPNDEGRAGALGYYELYDLLSARLEVRMLGVAPFAGVTIADFSAGEDGGVTIDTSMVERSEEPSYFLALASQREITLEPYVLLQIPAAAPPRPRPQDDGELARARGETSRLQGELDRVRAQLADGTRLSEERKRMAAAASTRAAELQARCDELEAALRKARLPARSPELDRALARQRELELAYNEEREARAAERDARAAERERLQEQFQQELDTMLERIGELEEALEAREAERESDSDAAVTLPLEPEPDEQTVRGYEFQIGELKKALAEVRNERGALAAKAARVSELEAQLAALERREQARPQGAGASEDLVREHEAEVQRLEGTLRERARRVEELRRELRESERIGKELVRELVALRENGQAAAAEAPDGAELEALLQKCSRYEADLQAANWKIAALSNELEERGESSADHDLLEEALRQARSEVAELRRELGRRAPEP